MIWTLIKQILSSSKTESPQRQSKLILMGGLNMIISKEVFCMICGLLYGGCKAISWFELTFVSLEVVTLIKWCYERHGNLCSWLWLASIILLEVWALAIPIIYTENWLGGIHFRAHNKKYLSLNWFFFSPILFFPPYSFYSLILSNYFWSGFFSLLFNRILL